MKYRRYNVYKRLSKVNERYGMGILLRPVIYMAVLSILSTLAAIISPYLYSLLLDEVMVNGDLGPLPYIFLAMICVYAAGAGLSALTVHTDAHFSNKVGLAVKTKLFDQLTGKEIAQVWDMEVGYYKKMLDEDCMEAAGFYTEQIGGFICSFLTAAVYLFLMLFIHPQLTAVSVLFIPVAALFGRYTGRKLNRFQNELWRKCSENTNFLTDTIQKWREIKAQNLELELTREYERRLLPEKELNIQQIKYLGLNRLFYEFKNNFIQNLLLYFLGGLFIISGQISIGSLLMFMSYLNRFSSNIDNIMNARTDFEGKKAVFERLL